MKIFLLKFTALGWEDLWQTLLDMGHQLSYIEYRPKSFEEDPILEKYITDRFSKEYFDAVMTFNYFQIISKVCNCFNIKYVSWVFDSPLLTLYSPTIRNKVNYIFIFDRILYQSLKAQGIDNVYYLPLGVNAKRLEGIDITEADLQDYSSEISFVGRLYDKKISYDALITLPPYYRGYLEAAMLAQTRIHGYNFLEEILTEDVITGICSRTGFHLGDQFTGSLRKVIADMFLGVKVTQMERMEALRNLSELYPVDLYTDGNSDMLPKVNNKGFADYYTQMPKIFKLSKINLNITHRTIQSGIPLRVFDIMGAGGFVLTNYQPEITEYFTEGEDLAIYYSPEDMLEKVKYYLSNEEERREIAARGCKMVRERHNYELRLREIFDIVCNEEDTVDKVTKQTTKC